MTDITVPPIDEIVGIARKAKSLMHREELVHLCSLAQKAPDGPGVEIGVYLGSSLIAWAMARGPRGVAFGVDDWSYKDIPDLYTKCRTNLVNAGVYATLIATTSEQASKILLNEVAFLLIDGDHTKEFIEQDIRLWTPKLMRGGVVAFHDYGRRKNDCYVTEAVDLWHRRHSWETLGCVTTLIGFRKP